MTRVKRREKPCACARCRGLKTADPRWGFDRAAVPGTDCLSCGQKIGRRAYELVTVLARFGQMFVKHRVCPKGARA